MAFAGGFYFEGGFTAGDEAAGVLHKGVNPRVVMVRVVMKQVQLLDVRPRRERHGIIHTTVAPADVGAIFPTVVLRIKDERVGVANKINHSGVGAVGVGFRIGKEADQAVGRKESVTDADAGVIGAPGADEDGADVEIEIFEFLDFDVAGQFIEGDGKVGAFHLAHEGGEQAFARAFAAEDAQPAFRVVDGRKKRQALDVIPVRVGDEQGQVERTVFEFGQERLSQRTQTGAGVQNDDFIAAPDFDAAGIAAVADGVAAGRGDGAAHTPKLDGRAGFDESQCNDARKEDNSNRVRFPPESGKNLLRCEQRRTVCVQTRTGVRAKANTSALRAWRRPERSGGRRKARRAEVPRWSSDWDWRIFGTMKNTIASSRTVWVHL